jgi:hypothetical protein
MKSVAGNKGVGLLFVIWAGLCLLSGHSLVSIVFVTVAICFLVPWIWKNYISKGFDSALVNGLIILAIICVVFAIFSIL